MVRAINGIVQNILQNERCEMSISKVRKTTTDRGNLKIRKIGAIVAIFKQENTGEN